MNSLEPRRLFVRLLQRETDAEGLALARDFLAANVPFLSGEGAAGHLPEIYDPQQLATALLWYAPTALLQWDWLRSIGRCAVGYRAANALLFRAYLKASGLDNPAHALAGQYRMLLNAIGIQLPALSALAEHGDMGDEAFLAPCAALSLAAFATENFGHILGYTLAHCQEGCSWLDWLQRHTERHGLPTGYVELHRPLLEGYGTRLQEFAAADDPAVAAGSNLYRHIQQASAEALRHELAAPPAALAERMLWRKLPYAVGHHGRVLLQGKSLDTWLEAGDLAGLRRALLESPYVNAESLADSRLLKAMEFGGPMFGVFSEQEQALLRQWLMEGEATPSVRAVSSRDKPDVRGWKPLPQTPAKLTARELYHRLLNRDAYPDSLPATARYAGRILNWTRLSAPLQTGVRRPFPYRPAAFRQRVDAIHAHELARYRPLQGAPKLPREIYLWGIAQMAPAILVDGCWLENAAGAEPAADEVRRRLLRTFADEAGAGRVEWNHPNVYRRLLESLDLQLPPVDTLEFAQHPRLDDAAFPLPAYLLAIGVWPDRFFPELLGLNLAIELNGLGATYMHAIDALRYYGIDPTILQLHLSIDNLASGHAALAREAIELHLEDMASLGGPKAVDSAWRRIWNGYLSLATAAVPFALAGLRRYTQWRVGARHLPPVD